MIKLTLETGAAEIAEYPSMGDITLPFNADIEAIELLKYVTDKRYGSQTAWPPNNRGFSLPLRRNYVYQRLNKTWADQGILREGQGQFSS